MSAEGGGERKGDRGMGRRKRGREEEIAIKLAHIILCM